MSGLGGFLVFFSSFEGSEGVRIGDIPSGLSHSPAAGSGFASLAWWWVTGDELLPHRALVDLAASIRPNLKRGSQ